MNSICERDLDFESIRRSERYCVRGYLHETSFLSLFPRCRREGLKGGSKRLWVTNSSSSQEPKPRGPVFLPLPREASYPDYAHHNRQKEQQQQNGTEKSISVPESLLLLIGQIGKSLRFVDGATDFHLGIFALVLAPAQKAVTGDGGDGDDDAGEEAFVAGGVFWGGGGTEYLGAWKWEVS